MLVDIVGVRVLEGYRLHLTFEDDAEGDVDLSDIVGDGPVFGPLRDPAFFGQGTVDPKLGTICWPNGADLDPVVLYHEATGTPPPDRARERPDRA